MTELEAANAAILNLTAEWHRAEIALDKARRERDAARAEVARLTAALGDADKSAQIMADDPGYSGDECVIDPVAFDAHRQAIRAALRQPAPARMCACGHVMTYHATSDDGQRVCMILGCSCITAPAAGRE